MLQIQLGPPREADPATDPLGRSRTGCWPGMSETEAWETGRGAWKFNADRALQQDEVQIVDLDGTVLAVAEITGIERIKGTGRYALTGRLLRGDPRVGRSTSHPHRSRNSVAYI